MHPAHAEKLAAFLFLSLAFFCGGLFVLSHGLVFLRFALIKLAVGFNIILPPRYPLFGLFISGYIILCHNRIQCSPSPNSRV